MILPGQYLWTGKWGSQEGKEATAEPFPSREGTSLLRVISRKLLLKQRFAFENQTENFLSKREDPIQKIPHSLIAGGFLRACWVLQSIPHCPHLLDMGLQQQLPVALGAPALNSPQGRRILPRHEQRVLGNRTWTWDEDQYYFVVDLSFSCFLSKRDFLDAANEDKLAGSLIITS